MMKMFPHTLGIIGVDGCHSKTDSGGVSIFACALDPARQLIPTALMICELDEAEDDDENFRISTSTGHFKE